MGRVRAAARTVRPMLPPVLQRASLVGRDSIPVHCIVVTPMERARGSWHVMLDGRAATGALPRAEAIASGLALGERIATPDNHVCVFLTENGQPLTRHNLVLELVAPPAAPGNGREPPDAAR